MKTIALGIAAMLLVAALFSTAMSQSQNGGAYEKKSYNYAEWAKGRFSEVVTVRNAGKIIYVAGVGAEDENSAQGGAIRYLGDFGAQCRYAWDKIKRLLEKHGATVDNIDKVWITDFSANTILRFDPKTETFKAFPSDKSGANVRQLNGRPGEVWGGESGSDRLVMIRGPRCDSPLQRFCYL